MTNKQLSALNLPQAVVSNLLKLGYGELTTIQAMSLPHVLNNKDVIAQAKTGSGKTAAFGIGLLTKIVLNQYDVQGLVLCPTRELADQVTKELRRLAQFTQNIKILTLCGGQSIGPQIKSLSQPAHIVVGTPGRIMKHLKKGYLQLGSLHTLVLDEADRMLDMGFVDDIYEIIDYIPEQRQSLLYSATYTDEIFALSVKIQNKAIKVETKETEKPNKITEYFYLCKIENMAYSVIKAIAEFKPDQVLVFVNTKIDAKFLSKYLNEKNIESSTLHGDLEQYQRNDVLVKFSNHSIPVLVATDVAARGLDIKQLSMVINYGLPFEHNVYTHRIGRTGRAGNTGIAVTLYSDKQQHKAKQFRNDNRNFLSASELQSKTNLDFKGINSTLVIEAGKKNKVRAGDILGALTGDVGLNGKSIGKIDIYDKQSYVAIERGLINKALNGLKQKGLKGKRFSVWKMK